MAANFSLVSLLYLIGAAQGAFLAMGLFSYRGGNRRANRYLGMLTLVFVAALVDYFFDITGLTEQRPWIRTLLWPKEFLYGILIYFYVRELTLPNQFPLVGLQWLHFLPALIHVLLTWPLLLLDNQSQLLILSQAIDQGWKGSWALLLGDVELYVTIAQISLYLYISMGLVRQHEVRIRQAFSSIEKINLRWLYRLLFGIFVVYLVWLVDELVSHWLNQEAVWDALLGLSMVVLIYSMGYLGLRQPLIFSHVGDSKETEIRNMETVLQLPSEPTLEEQSKYKSSPISESLGKSLLTELQQFMGQQQPFLDSEISLPKLAEQLNMSVNYLSQVINQHAGKNFFDFINSYRIESAATMLRQDPEKKITVMELSVAVGFNSKSAFYNAFKKHLGMTPSQYRVKTGN